MRGANSLNDAADVLDFLGAEFMGPRSAEHRLGMDHQLIARQGHERRVGAGLVGHIGHGPHFARIQIGQEIRQLHGVGHRPAGAVDPEADEVDVVLADLLLDHFLRRGDGVGADRALQIDADRLPFAQQRRVVLDGRGRQFEGFGHVAAVSGQIAGESPSPGVGAGELALLARPLHDDGLLGGVLLFKLLQFLGRDELPIHVGLDLQDFERRIEHPESNVMGTVRRRPAISA